MQASSKTLLGCSASAMVATAFILFCCSNSTAPNLDRRNLAPNLNTEAPLEFEKLVARYSKHALGADFRNTTKLVELALVGACQTVTPNASCATTISPQTIDDLLEHSIKQKFQLATNARMAVSEIDRLLLVQFLAETNDEYAKITKNQDLAATDGEQAKPIRSTISGDRYIIQNFDSDSPCGLSIQSHMEIMAIDLRGNLGGNLVCTTESLADFLPKGEHKIAKITTAQGSETLIAHGKMPTAHTGVVLVDSNTASSAVIFAQTLSNHGWQLIGEPMHPKSSIQAEFESIHGSYRFTIGEFQTLPESTNKYSLPEKQQ